MDPNDTNTPTEPTPEPSLDAELATAIDAGIEAASEPAPETPPADTPPADTAEPVPGTPEALAAEAAKTEAAKDGKATEAQPDAKTEPEKDEATEKEIGELGLKDRSAARFRELTAEVKALAPLKEVKAALDAAGVKDVADLPKLVKRADDGQFLLEQVQAVATPEQFGQTMDYLGLVSKASQGDRAAAEQAFTLIQGEYLALAKALGREVPGVHDPLAEHADLQAEVEKGDLPRARALEIAASRTSEKVAKEARDRAASTSQQQTAQEQAIAQGREALNALETEFGADPHYAAKRPALIEKIKGICREFPPGQWAAATRLAYAAIPNPAPAPQPTPSALRPGGPRPVIAPTVYDDPDAALEAGIAAASAG